MHSLLYNKHVFLEQFSPLLLLTSKFSSVNYAQFLEHKGLAKHGAKYHVVSIIGGQSSGKSTLLNRMFDTPFQVMDASKRQQTTKGIW